MVDFITLYDDIIRLDYQSKHAYNRCVYLSDRLNVVSANLNVKNSKSIMDMIENTKRIFARMDRINREIEIKVSQLEDMVTQENLI